MRQCTHQSFRVEDGFVFEHEIDGTGQLDGQDRVGFELITEPGFEALGQGTDHYRIAFGNDGGFAEGPTEVGVAEFGAAQALDRPALATVPLTSRQ